MIDDAVVQDVAREISEEAGTGSGYRPAPAPGALIEDFDPDGGESLADLDRRVAVLRGAG